MTTVSSPDFAAFRNGFGGSICERLGVDISSITTWRDYTETMIIFNAGKGRLVDAARRLNLSSGESVVLQAVLAAADFPWLSDELAEERTWRRMSLLSEDAQAAVVATILRRD